MTAVVRNRTGNTDSGLDFVLLKHSQVDIYQSEIPQVEL
jgi:hypothetical protein